MSQIVPDGRHENWEKKTVLIFFFNFFLKNLFYAQNGGNGLFLGPKPTFLNFSENLFIGFF